jgi:hypothetical protein
MGMNATNSGSGDVSPDTGAKTHTGEELLYRIELEAEVKALRTALEFERRVEAVLDLMDGSQGIRELFDFAVREIPQALAF